MEIKFDVKKINIVPIKEVRPNTWNPKDEETEEFNKIVESIKLKGQRQPIIVRENEGYEIIDGEQRYRACLKLGFEKVLIYNEGKVSTKEAMELTIWYQQQVPFNEVELAGIIKQMVKDYDNLELPFNQEQINDYIKMHDFNWDEYNKEYIKEDEGEPKMITCPECGHQFKM